ncbi:unnamed protein product [Symbiodinium sp. CCMP2456]|nr:unnamed protein product [Symbiodinium sp. CCMP2456]
MHRGPDMGRPSLASRQSVLHAFTQVFIDDEWLFQGVWFNLLTTLGCVHSMMFGTFHMDFFMQRGLTALEVAAVHSFFSVWNPLNDIFAGLLVDEWVQRGFGSRLQLALWAHIGYAVASWFAFQDLSLPVWLHYALAISSSDGFAAVASAVNGLVIIEQTEEDRQRIQIQRINSIFGCCEWLVMACAYFLWDARPANCGPFRSYLTIVCLLSVMTTAMAVKGLRKSATMGAKVGAKGRRSGGETFWQRLRPFLGMVRKHRNFWRYVLLTAALEAEVVFFRQFDVVLIRVLLTSWPWASKLLLVVCDPLCGTLSFALTWVAERPHMGIYGVSLVALKARMCVCVLAASVLGLSCITSQAESQSGDHFRSNLLLSLLLGLLMVACRAATRPATSLGGIVFASVIQEHSLVAEEAREKGSADVPMKTAKEIAQRAADAPKSAAAVDEAGKYWMLRAALVKPLNSLGPVTGSAVLAAGGYIESDGSTQHLTSKLWWTCATLPVVVSALVSAISLSAWSAFSLHGSRLEAVKAMRHSEQSL